MSQALHCSTQVLSVVEFESEAEAIALANDSEFGLGGGVISQDLERCQRVAEALECGIVWVNCSQPCFVQVGVPAPEPGSRQGTESCLEGSGATSRRVSGGITLFFLCSRVLSVFRVWNLGRI